MTWAPCEANSPRQSHTPAADSSHTSRTRQATALGQQLAITVTDVSLSPDPPKRGKEMTTHIVGTNAEGDGAATIEGGTLRATVTYLGIKVGIGGLARLGYGASVPLLASPAIRHGSNAIKVGAGA